MDIATYAEAAEPRRDGRRAEPRWMTLADLGVIVAGVALALTLPARASGWSPFLPPPPLLYLAVMGGLRLTVEFGLALALVVLFMPDGVIPWLTAQVDRFRPSSTSIREVDAAQLAEERKALEEAKS